MHDTTSRSPRGDACGLAHPAEWVPADWKPQIARAGPHTIGTVPRIEPMTYQLTIDCVTTVTIPAHSNRIQLLLSVDGY